MKFSGLDFFQEVLRCSLILHGLDVKFIRPIKRRLLGRSAKNGNHSLSPLHYNVHNKLADILHLMDTLLFNPILFVEQLLWNGLSAIVYQPV